MANNFPSYKRKTLKRIENYSRTRYIIQSVFSYLSWQSHSGSRRYPGLERQSFRPDSTRTSNRHRSPRMSLLRDSRRSPDPTRRSLHPDSTRRPSCHSRHRNLRNWHPPRRCWDPGNNRTRWLDNRLQPQPRRCRFRRTLRDWRRAQRSIRPDNTRASYPHSPQRSPPCQGSGSSSGLQRESRHPRSSRIGMTRIRSGSHCMPRPRKAHPLPNPPPGHVSSPGSRGHQHLCGGMSH